MRCAARPPGSSCHRGPASPRTISDRRRALHAFEASLCGRPLTAATEEDVLAWVARPLKPNSRRVYVSHIRSFFRWAYDEGLVAADPTRRIPPIKVTRSLPRPIPVEEVSRALTLATPRLRAWILLMCGAGLRAFEVAGLEPRDVVTGPTPMLRLRVTKGGHEETVPLHPLVLQALAVLPVRNGRWWDVSAHRVSSRVCEHLRRLGITNGGHGLRHSAISEWYEASGHDLLATQQLARHASVQNTQGYTKIAPERLVEVVAAMRLPA